MTTERLMMRLKLAPMGLDPGLDPAMEQCSLD
jgi:hypothetical protein